MAKVKTGTEGHYELLKKEARQEWPRLKLSRVKMECWEVNSWR